MKMSVVVPYLNGLDDSKGAMGLLKYVTSPETEYVIIDNGSTDPVEDFFTKIIKPKRMNYIRNEENIGMIKTQQQGYEGASGDVIAFLHNDVFIYDTQWTQKVIDAFTNDSKLGALGFFGAQGCGPLGERIQDVRYPGQMAGWSNLLEAEKHGMRLETPRGLEYALQPCAIFDGLCMIFRKEMLDKAGGFDNRYIFHHLYDRSAALQSLATGYHNAVINISCHHWGGMTANRSEYQNWINKQLPEHANYIRPGETNVIGADMWTHDENSRKFKQIWEDVLPLYVEDDYSFRTEGFFNGIPFKGDKIVGCDWLTKKIN